MRQTISSRRNTGRTTRRRKALLTAALFFAGAVSMSLAGCTPFSVAARGSPAGVAATSPGHRVSQSEARPSSATSDPPPSPTSTAAPGTEPGGAPGWAAGTFGPGGVGVEGCRGGTCTMTLVGEGAGARILGVPVSLRGLADGRANLRVAGRDVSCAPGDRLPAGGTLTLRCGTITTGSVTLAIITG